MSQKLEEIEARLALPDIAADRRQYRELLKEHHRLSPLVEAYRERERLQGEHSEAVTLAADTEAEPELRAFAAEEAHLLHAKLRSADEHLKELLLPKNEDDERNVIMEIRAGAGGEEAALFASDLYRMYRMYADGCGLSLELINANETELGGFREVSFRVTGEGTYAHLKFESGVHRVQRVPTTESQGRIQTSTVTVAVLPEAEDVEIELLPSELSIESMKSSGAGGQHINKTESAVRVLHIPTGIVVYSQSQRSQLQNKEAALRMLRTKLYDIKRRERDEAIASSRKSQVGSGDRSEKIRTYNYPQGRITDHRIGFSLYSLDSFMNGDIGAMIDALTRAETAEKLKENHDD
ncbi:MAG: peptide chain release factor 1 [Clostridia bacterium]|nr:peptide chain release factor 1 [Clostridia bacterium]